MLLGIIFFIVGIVVFFEPGGTYLALSVLFGIVVILSGAFELYLGTKAPTGSGKGWYIAGGVVEILLGILLLCTPSMLFTILPFVLGFWLLFRGFMAVGVASEMMGVGIKGAGWTMTLGILVIISAFLVLFNPIIGVGVVVFWVGLSLLLTSALAYMANSLKTVWLSKGQTIESTSNIESFIQYKDYEAGPDAIANIEDEAYKTYLLTFDKNGDGKLDKTEVEAITEINIKGLGIKSLKGVEYVNFTNVRKLDCSDNELTELPVAGFFTNLEEIDFSNNQLTGRIELNKCKKLRILKGSGNMLEEVAFENSVLESVDLSNNQLTRFQCSYNTSTLKSVNVANNLLSESSGFSCSDNAVLTDWNVSNNNLKYVYLHSTPMLENYNVSGNPLVELTLFGAGYGTALKTLDASNTALSSLDISGNMSLQSLNVMGCATLTKIFAGTLDVEAINIEKESYTIIETSTIVDAIKDNAFREFLIETYGSNGGITQEEADRVTDLELNADNAAEVKSLAGIEYFRNLKTLKVSGLESLDDTNLAVGNINLTSVDISLVKGLTAIDCNGLQSLTTFSLVVTGAAGTEVGPKRVELDKCPKIESVTVKDCRAIVAVTVTGCTELTSLNLSGSYLEKWESEPNSGKWIYPSINIYTNTKLTDPANFIPAANLVDIWATSAQIEAFQKYFETNYKWTGTWHSNDEMPSASVVR